MKPPISCLRGQYGHLLDLAGKNWYGLIEGFYIGIGTRSYETVFHPSALVERLNRGDVFTLGRAYLACQVRVELHPLLMVHLTVINNLRGPSGIFLPLAEWDVTQSARPADSLYVRFSLFLLSGNL